MLVRSAAEAISVIVTILAVLSPSPACAVGSASTKEESPPMLQFAPWGWIALAILGSVSVFACLCFILCCIFRRENGGPHTEHPSGTGGLSSSQSQIFRRQGTPVMERRSSPFDQAGPSDRAGPSSFNDRPVEFSFEELAAATNNFSWENIIGGGSFGTVYKGKLIDRRKVAIKRKEWMPRTNSQNKERVFQSVVDSLSLLRHKNVIGLVGYCKEEEELLLVYEYMKNGTLYDYLHPKNGEESGALNSWKSRITVLLDAAQGIKFVHSFTEPQIIHRDITSLNILLDANWVARLSGFSFAGPESEEELWAPSNVGYMDPENYCFNLQSDVYSFGIVMLEVLTGRKAMEYDDWKPINIVEHAMPLLEAGKLLDARVGQPLQHEAKAVEQVLNIAVSCVGKAHLRPSMTDIVFNLESALVSLQ
ncbi:hypothetical protein ZIOFF_009411 [Zingiber officinale]|uniref:Protein kinase domain-containing protein n=2 Tax=Zingiber officinale TaxID=94328 RepID=A0A8J5LWH5_ZINOF|nr:hypothetical protein ZIOFF_009411 [Zingiber officinale]